MQIRAVDVAESQSTIEAIVAVRLARERGVCGSAPKIDPFGRPTETQVHPAFSMQIMIATALSGDMKNSPIAPRRSDPFVALSIRGPSDERDYFWRGWPKPLAGWTAAEGGNGRAAGGGGTAAAAGAGLGQGEVALGRLGGGYAM